MIHVQIRHWRYGSGWLSAKKTIILDTLAEPKKFWGCTIAHELAHAELGHERWATPREHVQHELDAWLYASQKGWGVIIPDMKKALVSYAKVYPQAFIAEVKARGWDKC